MRKTKIVCTIGPATLTEHAMNDMISAGMNVARLNFSHGSYDEHKAVIGTLKKLRKKRDCPLAILLDTKGPEIRIKALKGGSVMLEDNKEFSLTVGMGVGDETRVDITFAELPNQLHGGETVLLDDGSIALEVTESTDNRVCCTVIRGGTLLSHKGVNIPGVSIDMEYLSEQDKQDILFGIENDVDFVAASFVRTAGDVIELRKFLDFNGAHNIKIISKIENLEGVENFDKILSVSDGIMVARGDMGVEVEYERLPGLQKRFIRKCYQSGKMVITATQMLESMILHPIPTRAEITDVANAVFDGTSAIMLSGETAMGKYPIEAINAMAKIAEQAEKDSFEMGVYKDAAFFIDSDDTTNAVCDAACTTARDINAKAIIAVTKYGQTARLVSKFRPIKPIVAATPEVKTYHQLALSWGVYPVLARYQSTYDKLFLHAVDCAKQIDIVQNGDKVIIVAGIPLDTPGSTNTLKVEIVGEKK